MRKTFKKLLSLTLATTMVVGLAGCGNTASNGGSSDSADKAAPARHTPLVSASLYSTRHSTLLQRASRQL